MRYVDAVHQANARYGIREVDDEAAQAIAAAWQSPGRIGHVLAQVASGTWERTPEGIEALHQDIYRTTGQWKTITPRSLDGTALAMLATWAMNGPDTEF